MKKSVKIFSIVLAIIMSLSVFPMVAFADENEDATAPAETVNAWKQNYALLLEELYDNNNYVSYQYVDQNMKAINDTMAVYTAFALYDNAWTNYASKSVDVDTAEQILLGLIEKADYTFDDGYVDEIVQVLETATDVNDFIQKVNDYAKVEVFESTGWSTTFTVIEDAVAIANAYQKYRDEFIEMYARVLSVQQANAYYVNMLQYIVDKNSDPVLAQAAQNLIDDINSSMEDVYQTLAASITEDAANKGIEYLAKIALDTNVYTAVALKVYQGGKSVADFLWNTSEQYPLICTVKTSYYFQNDVAEWTKLAVNGEDADKAMVAVDLLVTTREISEQALKNLKLAENDGFINAIKNKLYGTVYNDIEVNLAALDAVDKMFYENDIADMDKIERVLTVYCPVNIEVKKDGEVVAVLYDGIELYEQNDYGTFVATYSAYAKTYHKVLFLNDTYDINLVGTGEGYVTLIMDELKDDAIQDWSFTDRKVAKNTVISFTTDYAGTPYYTATDAEDITLFNDEFVPSEQPTVTVKDVADATGEVTKEKAKTFGDLIREFFEKLFASLFSIFK